LINQEYALIVAGGKGTRIKSSVPKQFVELAGKPVLLHTLEAFFAYSEEIKVVLTLAEEDLPLWNEITTKYQFDKPVLITPGGNTRFQSVRNGLSKIGDAGLVAIHDGVRPLVDHAIISEAFRLARIHGSAIASVPLKESIRIESDGNSRALDRTACRLIQTPQAFSIPLIREAYEVAEDPTFTDDASVAERSGEIVFLFEGSYRNIKITTEEDLVIAEALLTAKAAL
jgi:2-C-methyl-D-erythritol 4-phosphate cytidylyltransferase